ncbi:MAG: DoxX family membrane protein [Muribaculaceae bacterium]|nr:DoxX family membrane protein [Muribaculaceae bacterium]
MKGQKYSLIIAFIIGIILIISGLSKAASFDYFNAIINNYITLYPEIIATIIIVSELTLGIMLIFGIYLKITSLITTGLILFFVIVFTFGLIFLGIHDCGCFGKVKFLNSSPVFLYIRNAFLIVGSIYIYKINKTTTQVTKVPIPLYISTIVIVSIAIYMCGVSSNNSTLKNRNKIDKKIAFNDNILRKYLEVSSDSTYLIYLFSYDCPHCINSFGNLLQYNNKKYVDKIVGITKKNPEAKEKFMDFFNPTFEIIEISENEFYNITEEFPVSYFIKNDSIIKIMTGEIPSAYFLNP